MGVVELNSVVESKATLGLRLAVASPNLRREGTAGARARCFGPVKEMLSKSVKPSSGAGDGKERTGSCAGIGLASVKGRPGGRTGEGKAAIKADGGRVADGSRTSAIRGGELAGRRQAKSDSR